MLQILFMPFQHPNVEKKELVIRLLLDLADRIQWLSDGHAPAIISPPSVIVLPKTINVQIIVNTQNVPLYDTHLSLIPPYVGIGNPSPWSEAGY